jgi:hypothetical protein
MVILTYQLPQNILLFSKSIIAVESARTIFHPADVRPILGEIVKGPVASKKNGEGTEAAE